MREKSIAWRTIGILFAALTFFTPHAFPQSTFKGDAKKGAAKAQTCDACHGTPKKPALPGMPMLFGQQPEFLVLQMFFIRERLRDVPQMAGLLKGVTDAELTDMAAYFASQQPPRVAAKLDPKLRDRGAELSKRLGCGSCHMPDYSGQRQVPRLTGQREDYLVTAMKDYRDNKRTGSDTSMNAVLYQISDGDIGALAHYLANLK
jgi:cytochrome c553